MSCEDICNKGFIHVENLRMNTENQYLICIIVPSAVQPCMHKREL